MIGFCVTWLIVFEDNIDLGLDVGFVEGFLYLFLDNVDLHALLSHFTAV